MSDDPGLDLTRLRALRPPRHDLDTITARIEAHLDAHEGYLAFSGGKDSLTVLHLALRVDPEIPVVFFDSGLEYPETYTYLRDLADNWSLNLHTIPAEHTTLQLLVASGAWDHNAPPNQHAPDLRETLIEAPARTAHVIYGAGELWGVRAAESTGRAAAYATALRRGTTDVDGCTCTSGGERRRRHGGVIRRVDGTVAYGPVWDWTDEQIWAHLGRHRVPVNPVYAKLRKLGAPESFWRVSHMIDASRLDEGRATWLRRGWPDLFDELATALPRLREFI